MGGEQRQDNDEGVTMKSDTYLFSIEGGFDVDKKLKPETSQVNPNTVIAFNSKAKRISLIMALEVEDDNGNIQYITSEKEMEKLGFTGLEYRHLDFYKI